MIRKLQPIIPRASLLTNYKSFFRPHLDYDDVIYDHAFNEPFQNKLDSVQYNAALPTAGAIKGSSRENLYQELDLETLISWRWYQKLFLFFKLKKIKHSSYLFDIILLRPRPNSTFNVHNPHGIKLLRRLRVALSYLHERKLRHNFQDSLDPFCNCGRHIETIIYFFLHCSSNSNERKTPFEKISNIKRSLLDQNDSVIVETVFFESNGLNDEENAWIAESTIECLITTERFIAPLL